MSDEQDETQWMRTVMIEEKSGFWEKLAAEGKAMIFLFIYLALLFSAFTTYRRLLLAQYGIPFFQYGNSLIEALVLAKVISFGRLLQIGERFDKRPLIVPTLYKTLWFGIVILAFSIFEHLIVGWWRGKATVVILYEILNEGVWEISARTLVKLVALVPLCAVWEIGRALGEKKLFELFFTKGIGPSDADSELLSASLNVAPDDQGKDSSCS